VHPGSGGPIESLKRFTVQTGPSVETAGEGGWGGRGWNAKEERRIDKRVRNATGGGQDVLGEMQGLGCMCQCIRKDKWTYS
jgi:hypothetical protein